MSRFNRVLCPVDMSKYSLETVELATNIAQQKGATLVLMYVCPKWLQENSPASQDNISAVAAANQDAFDQLRPTDDSVEFEHLFLHGNAGPEIVRESKRCDIVVIGSQGRSANDRTHLGSVAQYVMRNANCTVITVKNGGFKTDKPAAATLDKRYVTEAMHQVAPVRGYDPIEDVIGDLERANETAVPVINEQNETVGILTQTDIDHYVSLCQRLAEKDPSVVKEVYEVNEFGSYRVDNVDFQKVKRHMSSPVTTILNTQNTEEALDLFAANENIHHLVVVDDQGHPLGVLEPKHCSSFHQLRQNHKKADGVKAV